MWKAASATAGQRPPVLLTTFRSDPEYPQFVAGVAWIDSGRTHLAYVPGLAEPPEPSKTAARREVPPAKRDRIAATFNGGFPLETSNAGLIYRGKVLEPMVNGIATVVEYRDGRIDIVRWESGENIRPNDLSSRSRTCRRSSTKASSTRTSATAPNGARRSTTRSGSGARASASTAAAT